jgi:hypothetical protein
MPADFTKGVGADGVVVFHELKLPDGTSVMESIPYKKIIVAHNSDLNTFTDDGFYASDGAGSGGPQNGPSSGSAFANWTCQVNNLQNGIIVQDFTTAFGSTWSRIRNAVGTWLGWGISYGGGNGVNTIQTQLFTSFNALDTGTATTSDIATLVNNILAKLKSGI